jgi:class 3 adenylate cyclase
MAYKEFYYRWEFELKSNPEQLWTLIADTNRFNRDAGLPRVEKVEGASARKGRKRLRLFRFGMPVEWEEQPFEWVKPFRFGVVRKYFKGPVAEIKIHAELTPKEEGTHLVYEIWAKPKNAIGRTAIPFQFGVVSQRSFAKAFNAYDKILSSREEPPLYQKTKVEFSSGGHERLEAVKQKLIEENANKDAVKRLIQLLSESDDLTVSRIRPHEVADYFHLSRRDMLETCLFATRHGLLDLQWDLICPHCRGAADTSKSLSGLNSNSYCDSCNIDFNVNFDASVELTFAPNAAVRNVETQTFCVGGPQVTPHIIAQQLLKANEERVLKLPMEEGRYRVRVSNLDGGSIFTVNDEGDSSIELQIADGKWQSQKSVPSAVADGSLSQHSPVNVSDTDIAKVKSNAELKLENKTDEEQLFIIERMKWNDQAATAAEVTALQVFRDLFSNEALRQGELISVGTLTVLFTDLKGSTKLYRDIGDAPAFGRVMRHFDVLRSCIAEKNGAVVKTIGDAVMAVFKRPADALKAIFKAQELLAHPTDGSLPLRLKVGIHTGHAIAVTLNERLDYFGGTINMAARLEGISSGEDVIISSSVYSDPEVKKIIESEFLAESFTMQLKGFDEEDFELYRVRPLSVVRRPLLSVD